MLAEEREPQPPQRVGAGEHHLHLPAGMGAGMIGERQLQHVLEIVRQHHVAAPMREPVGVPGDQRRREDHEQTETDPGADQRRQRACRRFDAGRQCSRQGIDDTAEQHRLDELRRGERDIGKRQRHGQPRVGPQQAEDAKVDADEGHDAVLAAESKRTIAAAHRKLMLPDLTGHTT